MVDRPIVDILHLSVAHSHFHELVALVILALVVLWEVGPSSTKFVKLVLLLLTHDVVGADLLLNLSEVSVHVHGLLSDWDHGVNNVPKDTLDKWSGGQGSLIGESSVEVNELDKLFQI